MKELVVLLGLLLVFSGCISGSAADYRYLLLDKNVLDINVMGFCSGDSNSVLTNNGLCQSIDGFGQIISSGGGGKTYTGVSPIVVDNDANTIALNTHIPTETEIDGNFHTLLIADRNFWKQTDLNAILQVPDFNRAYVSWIDGNKSYWKQIDLNTILQIADFNKVWVSWKDGNTTYAKISDVNGNFLLAHDVNKVYIRQTDGNAWYVKLSDINSVYSKITDTNYGISDVNVFNRCSSDANSILTTSGCVAITGFHTDTTSSDANKAGAFDANVIADWNSNASITYEMIANPPAASGSDANKAGALDANVIKVATGVTLNNWLDQNLQTNAKPRFNDLNIFDELGIKETTGGNLKGIVAYDDTNRPISAFTPLDLSDSRFWFFSVNRAFNGTSWVDLTDGTYAGSSFQAEVISKTTPQFQWYTGAVGSTDMQSIMKLSNSTLTVGGAVDLTLTNGDITTSGALPLVFSQCYSTSDNSQSYFVNRKSSSATLGTIAETVNGEELGWYMWQGVNSGGGFGNSAAIQAIQSGSSGATYVPTDILLKTATASANLAEGLRVETDKDVSMRNDNAKFYWGTGSDASITYDGTNMLLNPKEVGTGQLRIYGDINAMLGNIYTDKNYIGNQIFGEMYNKSDAGFVTLTLPAQDVYVGLTDLNAGSLNGFAKTTDNNLLVQNTGKYLVNATTSLSTSGNGEYGIRIYVDETGKDNCYTHLHLSSGAVSSQSLNCILSLTSGNKVSIRIDDHANPPNDPTFYSANLTITRIGN